MGKYDPKKVMKELLDTVSEIYHDTGELKLTAEEIGMSALKVRKLLITAGEYESKLADEVGELFREGKSVADIQELTGLGRSSVNGYLPYMKIPYNAKEVSRNAERIRLYRKRKECVDHLQEDMSEASLWDTIIVFQNYPFYTVSELLFRYEIKKGRDGSYNRELIVSRRKESKTLVWSSVKMAFENAKMMRGKVIERPKALGDMRGISYVYPMFYRFGIIEVPDRIAEKKRQISGG